MPVAQPDYSLDPALVLLGQPQLLFFLVVAGTWPPWYLPFLDKGSSVDNGLCFRMRNTRPRSLNSLLLNFL